MRRFKVAVQMFGHAIAKQRTGNGTRFKETEMEQVAVVGQCEGGGIRVASILGRTMFITCLSFQRTQS